MPSIPRPGDVRAWPRPAAGLAQASRGPGLRLVEAAAGRCVAVHLGAYDLTASLGVTAVDQRLDHPTCDVARVLN
jgi:hypothetical protein